MRVLVLNQSEIYELLPMEECIEVMAEALASLARGEALNPLRRALILPEERGLLATMPAYWGTGPALGVKVISIFPGNEGSAFDTHQGAVLLFDVERGHLRAVMDAAAITALRTAATSGVATRLLAREDAGDLALLGSGVQARTHLQAMQRVRRIRRVRVWSRQFPHAQAFAERYSHGEILIEPVPTAREAVVGADLICTVTAAREPVLSGEWLSPGAHINAVGSSTPSARELDTAAVVASRLFVDRRESALHEAGDFLIPKAEGAIGDDHIRGEIGDLLLGRVAGRTSPTDITLFKSLGLAIEDVAAACVLYRKAQERGVGQWITLDAVRK
ncbi:MAG TPA: ornithine cyclodeaminase family protein [Blastocatellia bacterium]|nr:ornithine cyclodeaminase family protein [Blastocatellia bacterium]